MHLAAAVVVPGCLALTWWQATRAAGGNTLSWAYTFEWPLFAGYAVYMWWRLLHDTDGADDVTGADDATAAGAAARDIDQSPGPPSTGARVAEPRAGEPGSDGAEGAEGHDAGTDELAAYNRYLAALNASGRTKRW